MDKWLFSEKAFSILADKLHKILIPKEACGKPCRIWEWEGTKFLYIPLTSFVIQTS